jgi:hypothetical protein
MTNRQRKPLRLRHGVGCLFVVRRQREGLPAHGLLLLATLFSAGCVDPLDTRPDRIDLDIRTDKTAYVINADTAVSVALVNRGTQPAFLVVPSFFVHLQIRRAGDWEDLPPWYAILAVAGRWRAVTQADTVRTLVHLNDITVPAIIPGSGTYRFRYTVYADSTTRSLLPVSDCVSNTFDIELQRS